LWNKLISKQASQQRLPAVLQYWILELLEILEILESDLALVYSELAVHSH
jgi:hypothetical protein